jgi:peptidoglycan hydrolase-like protein with peptidoglycan-binding domain
MLNFVKGADDLDVDGIFGPKTEAAVRAFQQNENLAVDGIVGTQTWTALLRRWLLFSQPG